MIFANAKTAEEISQLLRIMDSEETIQARMVADRLLGKTTGTMYEGYKGILIRAPRRSGKTTELLKYAEDKNPWGQFVVVCHNLARQQDIIRVHWEVFNKIDQVARVAARLLGEPITGQDVNPPLLVSPGNFHLLHGHNKPIYVDELGEISNMDTMKMVLGTGRFIAAVTS